MTSKKGGQVTIQLTPERYLILAIEEAIIGKSRKEIVYNWIDTITPRNLKFTKELMNRQDTMKLNFSLTEERNDWVNQLAEELEISRHRVLTLIVDAIAISRAQSPIERTEESKLARIGENP